VSAPLDSLSPSLPRFVYVLSYLSLCDLRRQPFENTGVCVLWRILRWFVRIATLLAWAAAASFMAPVRFMKWVPSDEAPTYSDPPFCRERPSRGSFGASPPFRPVRFYAPPAVRRKIEDALITAPPGAVSRRGVKPFARCRMEPPAFRRSPVTKRRILVSALLHHRSYRCG